MRVFLLLTCLLIGAIAEAVLRTSPESDYCVFASEYKLLKAFTLKEHSEALNPIKYTLPCAPETIRAQVRFNMKSWTIMDSRHDELEAFMVTEYIGHGYQYLNHIAKEPRIARESKLIEIMDRALAKLPNHRGWVYAGNRTMKLATFKPGMLIKFRGYFSTSLETVTPVSFATNGDDEMGVVFKILVKNGKDISRTYNKAEKEILLPRNSVFQVRGFSLEEGKYPEDSIFKHPRIKMVVLEQVGEFPEAPLTYRERLANYWQAKFSR